LWAESGDVGKLTRPFFLDDEDWKLVDDEDAEAESQ
jgi:hypothetical protein